MVNTEMPVTVIPEIENKYCKNIKRLGADISTKCTLLPFFTSMCIIWYDYVYIDVHITSCDRMEK